MAKVIMAKWIARILAAVSYPLSGANGGTGVSNSGKTLTLASNFATTYTGTAQSITLKGVGSNPVISTFPAGTATLLSTSAAASLYVAKGGGSTMTGGTVIQVDSPYPGGSGPLSTTAISIQNPYDTTSHRLDIGVDYYGGFSYIDSFYRVPLCLNPNGDDSYPGRVLIGGLPSDFGGGGVFCMRHPCTVTDPSTCGMQVCGSNGSQYIGLGYDSTNNVGVIQSTYQGNSNTPLIIQPQGPGLSVGKTTNAYMLDVGGTIAANAVGSGLRVKEGTNAKQGTAALTAGTVTVANTSVTSSSRIFITAQDNSTVGSIRVSARVAGTSFTITSTANTDTGVIAYQIFEPA